MSKVDDLRRTFTIDDTVTQFEAYAAEAPIGSTRNRYQEWKAHAKDHGLWEPEFLLPRIVQDCPPGLPAFMTASPGSPHLTDAELRERIRALEPWMQSFVLRDGVETAARELQLQRVSFRSHLLSGTVEQLLGSRLGSTSILDMACNSGFFSFDMMFRGAGSVTGVELREVHHHQAQFLAEAFGIQGIEWILEDVYAFDPGRTWDVVFNFGLMYHLTQPLEVAAKTYALCEEFAVFDSMVHLEPFAGFIAAGQHDTDIGIMGNHPMQIEPTYRGLIELLYDVGFRELVEVVGRSPLRIPYYDQSTRRTIIAFK
jgi:SAM-dependent methyltransferase